MGRAANALVSGLAGAVGFTVCTLTPTSVQASNSIAPVDSDGNVGDYTSMVLDGAGNPVVSYQDVGNGDLKVLHCNDANCAGDGESVVTVDSDGEVGFSSSLVLDAAGNPVVGYYDSTSDLKLLHCNDPNCAGGDESILTVASGGAVGHSPDWFPSLELELDAAGNPVVSYFAWGSSLDLELLHCNDPDCAGGDESILTVDSDGDVGRVSSLELDAAGNPVVGYYDWGNSELKLLHCNDASCAGGDDSILTLDSDGDVGYDPSLALDAAGNPVISYWDYDNDDLKLLHCNDANCAGGDDSILTVDSDGAVGEVSSLVLDAAGNPVVSYYASGQIFDLKLVHCNDANCAGGDDSSLTVDSAGDVGWESSLALDAAGNPVISYNDYGNGDLKLTHCDTVDCGVDGTPPVASITLSPAAPDGRNGWYRSPVQVAVAATDDNHVAGIRCALDPSRPPQSFDELPDRPCPPFIVTVQGSHVVYAAAVDQAANAGPVVKATFNTIGALRCQGQVPTHIGTSGDDVIVGTRGDDVIAGLGGDDTIRGLDGNDLICAGAGKDTINGGRGDDRLAGDAGADTATYATAPSAVNANLTTNTASGGAGHDRFAAVEHVTGSRFNDRLTGSADGNTIRGGGGNDQLAGLAGNDRLAGGGGNDHLDGGTNLDRGNGGAGADTQVRCEIIRRIP